MTYFTKLQTRNCLNGSKHAGEFIVTRLIYPIGGYIEGIIVEILLHQIARFLINKI